MSLIVTRIADAWWGEHQMWTMDIDPDDILRYAVFRGPEIKCRIGDIHVCGDTMVSLRDEACARAVLESLRKPTQKMLSAGAAELPDYDPGNDDAERCWVAMIDVALGGKAPSDAGVTEDQ